ncbi:TPA: ead/Ea22-like family protein [Klebsiella oxytoca]
MIENTEITAEKLEEIRQRYRPTEVPECHICGAEMTIQRMSASRITYGCAGAIYDGTGCHYAEGRSLADDHYAESRITVVDVSDPDVLAMVEALEKAQHTITEMDNRIRQQNRNVCELFDDGKALRERIAELESRTVKLPDDEDGQAYGFGKWANGKLPATVGTMTIAYCEDAWRAAFEVFSSAAGIKVEADIVDADASNSNQPGMVVAVHIDAGDFVKVEGQVYEVEETDFDDHDVTLWFVGGETLKCAAGRQIEVVSAQKE